MNKLMIAAVLPVLGILWIADLPQNLGFVFIQEQYLAVIMSISVFIALASEPMKGTWVHLDRAFGLIVLISWLWMAYNYDTWLLSSHIRTPDKWIPGVIALAGTIEGARRHCGPVLTVLGCLFLAYGFYGWLAPGVFEGAQINPARYILYLYTDSNGVPGLVLNVAANQILGFIVFGATLTAVGGSDAMTRIALSFMGHKRGGPAKVAILGSSMFGSLSGSTVANVMSTGVVTIPMMKKAGFPPKYAGAIEAVASNGGQIAPPVMGATAFVIAEFLQVSYAKVVLAALIPAVLYYFLLYCQVDRYAYYNNIQGEDRKDLPRQKDALLKSWPLLAPIGVLVWFLFIQGYAPGKSALIASGVSLLLYAVTTAKVKDYPAILKNILVNGGTILIPIIMVSGVAGIIIGTINITGLGFSITMSLGRIAEVGGVIPLLATTAVLAIILGVGMPTTGVYVILSVLLAPALIRFGINDMSAHLFIFYFGLLSMLTPPVAVASYSAASIAESDMWETGIVGVKLAITAYLLPFVFVLNPALLMNGDTDD